MQQGGGHLRERDQLHGTIELWIRKGRSSVGRQLPNLWTREQYVAAALIEAVMCSPTSETPFYQHLPKTGNEALAAR